MTFAKHTNQHGNKHEAGFTLLEVMAALAIFFLGILAIMALQSSSIRGNSRARGVTDISVYAADRLEKLLVLPFDDPALVEGTFTPAQSADGIDNDYDGRIDPAGVAETGPLTVTWTITNDWPMLNVKTIAVTVTHNHPDVQRVVTLQNVKPQVL